MFESIDEHLFENVHRPFTGSFRLSNRQRQFFEHLVNAFQLARLIRLSRDAER